MHEYEVTYEGMKGIIVYGFSIEDAIKYARDILTGWGYEVSGIPTVEELLCD